MDTKPVFIIFVASMLFVLESLFPHKKNRTRRLAHGLPHVITAVLNGAVTRFLLAGITLWTISWADAYSLGLLRMSDFPLTLRDGIAFLLFDAWMYYWHRANHLVPLLWRFHRAHHSDIDVDATTAFRFHPGELVLSSFIRLPIIVVIGLNISELVLIEFVLNCSTLFHHSNVALPATLDRMLRLLVVTPNMHRVHHSVVRGETNSNFSSMLSLWDRLGRTFRIRGDTVAITFGLPTFREKYDQHLSGFLFTPFR